MYLNYKKNNAFNFELAVLSFKQYFSFVKIEKNSPISILQMMCNFLLAASVLFLIINTIIGLILLMKY